MELKNKPFQGMDVGSTSMLTELIKVTLFFATPSTDTILQLKVHVLRFLTSFYKPVKTNEPLGSGHLIFSNSPRVLFIYFLVFSCHLSALPEFQTSSCVTLLSRMLGTWVTISSCKYCFIHWTFQRGQRASVYVRVHDLYLVFLG